jgi:hypothetical protein
MKTNRSQSSDGVGNSSFALTKLLVDIPMIASIAAPFLPAAPIVKAQAQSVKCSPKGTVCVIT